ncbi:hypothetical protein BDF14DRAFT_1742975 [Spinellus fusiger]|nr:hypothetical protein BDF14DRAFT_1742975 [Spinellus fusiger]
MADTTESVAQFMSMTSATPEQAQQFLDMCNGNLEEAITQFYDTTGPEEPVSSSSPSRHASPTSSRAAAPQQARTKIRTINDLASGQPSDSDDDERETFFTGGEKSGMIVQGPNKKAGNSLVEDILRKAAEGGSGAEEQAIPPTRANYFTGSGYTLGSDETPSQLMSQPVPVQETQEAITRYLTFWKNGFSVDDGPLFRYDDPANEAMLSAINSGRAPLSLLNVRHGQAVDVKVAKRQNEDYVPPPKAPPKPFEGAGHRLGSPATHTPPPQTPSPASSSLGGGPVVDESQPTTTLQLRLGDGTRLVAKFNHTHTVADIRQYIDASHPHSNYVLQTAFPVKQLDNAQTLKEAGLFNSVVVQRYQ